MTLLSWVRLAGDVWLAGTHSQWPGSASTDPLVIEAHGSRYPGEPTSRYFDAEHQAWRERAARDPEEAGLFVLPLAPDRLIKNNVSGGPPYGLILPDSRADGLFAAETTMPFQRSLQAERGGVTRSRLRRRSRAAGSATSGCKTAPPMAAASIAARMRAAGRWPWPASRETA